MADANTISSVGKARAIGATDEASKAKLQKATKDFESLLVGYMLKSMRGTVQKSGMEKDDFGGDMMESMFDMQFAQYISGNSNLGLGQMLYKQLTGEDLPKGAAHQSYTLPPASTVTANKAGSAPPAQPLTPPAQVQKRVESYGDTIQAAAQKYGVDANLIKAVMASESGGKPFARSAKNAKGLMQLVDSTAADMGVKNVWNPQQNIFGGAKYLKELIDKFQGNLPSAVASYNAGPSAVEKQGGVPAIKETKEYVARVLNYLQGYEQQELYTNDDN